MNSVQEPVSVVVYLNGELNPGFLRLKRATVEMLDELNIFTKKEFRISYVNPSGGNNQRGT